MGYYSTVAYVIKFRDTEPSMDEGITLEAIVEKYDSDAHQGTSALQHMKNFVALVMAMGGENAKALRECNVDWETHCIAFHAEDVKWYDTYSDVQAHYQLMSLAEERCQAAFIFNSINEDNATETRTDEDGWGTDLEDVCRVVCYMNMELNTEPVGDALRVPD
jgi:hypothetical protein